MCYFLLFCCGYGLLDFRTKNRVSHETFRFCLMKGLSARELKFRTKIDTLRARFLVNSIRHLQKPLKGYGLFYNKLQPFLPEKDIK